MQTAVSERALRWYRRAGERGPRKSPLPQAQPAPFCIDWALGFFRALEGGTTEDCLRYCAELRRAVVCDRTARWAAALWDFRSSPASWRGEVACASNGFRAGVDWEAPWDVDYLTAVLGDGEGARRSPVEGSGWEFGPVEGSGWEFGPGEGPYRQYTPSLLEAVLHLRGRDMAVLLREARSLGAPDRALRAAAFQLHPRAAPFLHGAAALSGPPVPGMEAQLVLRVLLGPGGEKAENLLRLLQAGVRRPPRAFLSWLLGDQAPELGPVSDWMWAGCVAYGAERAPALLGKVCASPELPAAAGWLWHRAAPRPGWPPNSEELLDRAAVLYGGAHRVGEVRRLMRLQAQDRNRRTLIQASILLRRWQGGGGARAAWLGAVWRGTARRGARTARRR